MAIQKTTVELLVQVVDPLLGQNSYSFQSIVFEPARVISFIGNVYVIQASKQLHCWARCVQK